MSLEYLTVLESKEDLKIIIIIIIEADQKDTGASLKEILLTKSETI